VESLFRSAGIDDARIEWARARLGAQFRVELDALIEQAAVETVRVPGYEHLRVDEVRGNTSRALFAIVATLEGGDWHNFGAVLRDVAYDRASQGLQPRALFAVVDFTEVQIGMVAARCLHGCEELVLAAIVARRICDGGREVIVDAFQRAHLEARESVTRLARQFSAPILPALPGVLVLPIVGAIGPARARQIVDVLLAAIAGHAAHTAIVDMTGLTAADATLPAHLQRVTTSARLLGARVVLAGISPTVARILVDDPRGLHGATIHATLADALVAAHAAS
jgi:anti-anti-sigma regulatory factor